MNPLEAAYYFFASRRKRNAEAHRVDFPATKIISVGNLSTGGTGKTPVVQWLAKSFADEGVKAAIVARGYGGEYSGRGAIVSDGEKILLTSQQSGDEAFLHARSLRSTPVIIGRDRVAATHMAIETFAPEIVLLDDGFQYWSLARDFDLVLLDARRPFGNGKLLPSGRLREPQSALRRASGVLLTRADAANADELQRARDEIARWTSAPIFTSNHAPLDLRDESSGEVQALGVLQSLPVAALSALANNESFFQSLRELGSTLGSTLARGDHHSWSEKEVQKFALNAKNKGAKILMTTEKDAVKIEPDWCAPLALWSLRIEIQIESESALRQLISDRIG